MWLWSMALAGVFGSLWLHIGTSVDYSCERASCTRVYVEANLVGDRTGEAGRAPGCSLVLLLWQCHLLCFVIV